MNEKIKQLAEQAGFVDYMVLNRIESKEEVLENFAKLIVKECAKSVAGFHKEDEEDEYILHSASEVIKRHFGV